MTISPPSKVKSEKLKNYQVMASGIDTLYLSIDVVWKDEFFLGYLKEMKYLAEKEKRPVTVTLSDRAEQDFLNFRLFHYGHKGHEWILRNEEYSLTVGDWRVPQSRPSIMFQISSETLWRYGPQAAIGRILNVLQAQGAELVAVKPSRVDLCLDMVFPEKKWGMKLTEFKVSRAGKVSPEIDDDVLNGLIFGKGGAVMARIYNKPLEIAQISKKFWMYDIWGVSTVPDGQMIIRIESQFRRESIKDLGMDTIESLFQHLDNLWAYFSQDWLIFKDKPGKHHTQRKVLPWWKIVQNGFFGVQGATPLIRCKSLSTQEKQFFCQVYGLLAKLTAIRQERTGCGLGKATTIDESMRIYRHLARLYGKDDTEFSKDVLDKRSSYHESVDKIIAVNSKRLELGHPSNLPVEDIMKQKDRGQNGRISDNTGIKRADQDGAGHDQESGLAQRVC